VRADTKVTQVNSTFKIHQDVLGLDVSVDLTTVVKVLETRDDLLQNCSDKGFILDSVLELQMQDVFHGSCVQDRHHKPEVCFVTEAHKVLDNILVLQVGHDIDLFPDVVNVSILE
jgi:hypothetical protein